MHSFILATLLPIFLLSFINSATAQDAAGGSTVPIPSEASEQIVVRLLSDLRIHKHFEHMKEKLNPPEQPFSIDESKLIDTVVNGSIKEYGDILVNIADKPARLIQTDHLLIIKFKNRRTVPLSNSEIISVIVDDDDKNPIEKGLERYCRTAVAPYYCLIPIGAFPQVQLASHNALIKIKAGERNVYYARRFRLFQSYGWDILNQGVLGLWVPVGLFATNFQRTTNGIQFSALPVGVALGSKLFLSKTFYVGLSGIAMWAITNGDKTDPSGVKSDVATLGSLGAGFLLDLSSIMYLSATHQWNFADGQTNPGWMLGVGFGADLLKRIASGS